MKPSLQPSLPDVGDGPVAILGAGVSGRAAARLVRATGREACVFDEGGDGRAFDPSRASGYAAFVVSPGFAATHPWRRAAETSGRPVFGELGFAAAHWRGPLYGVTGTNGKTTLTRLLADAFRSGGRSAAEAGNIGFPLADLALEASNDGGTAAVCEISSFQGELARGLRLDGLLWTHFAEDHLDRYPDAETYFRAKARLFASLRRAPRGAVQAASPGREAVPNAPAVVGAEVAEAAARYGVSLPPGARVAGDADDGPPPSGSAFERAAQRRNFAVARAFAGAVGLAPGAVDAAAAAFAPSPHRFAEVATVDGARYRDDSKATNFAAALAGLDGAERPLVWIAGGRPKGGDIGAFARAAAERADVAVVYGEASAALAQALRAAGARVVEAPRFDRAVAAAVEAAAGIGAAEVLLSPGFASQDQFRDYAERGKRFAETVLNLKPVPMGGYPQST